MKDQLAILRDLVILAAIVLFGSGWLVAYFYFKHFGISLNSLDLPYHAFYVFSLIPFGYIAGRFWLLVLFGLACAVLVLLIARERRGRVPKMAAMGVFLLAVLYPVAYRAAQAEAQCVRRGGGTLSIGAVLALDAPKDADRDGAPLVAALRSGLQRNAAILLAQSRTHYYILYQADFATARRTGDFNRAPVFHVPMASVKMLVTTAPALPHAFPLPLGGGCQ